MRKDAAVPIFKKNGEADSGQFRRIFKLFSSRAAEAEKHLLLTTKLHTALGNFEAKWKQQADQTEREMDTIKTQLASLSTALTALTAFSHLIKSDLQQLDNSEKVAHQLNTIEHLVKHIEASNVSRYDYLEADRNIFRQINGADAAEMGRRIRLVGRKLTPCKSVEHQKIRLGADADGGYVCLDDFEGIKTALSFGIDTDVSWDLDVAKRGIVVHQFDHTVDGPPVQHQNFRFNKQMIAPSAENGHASIHSIIEANLLSDPASVVLKIDIEGSEWDVFDSTPEQELDKFSQIICEFHGFQFVDDDAFFQKVSRVLDKLGSLFQVVHVHGNNYCPMFSLGGVPFPSLLEVTFVNRRRSTFQETEEIFPTQLDQANNQKRPDFFLGRFEF
jgi:hypothetical protein